MQEPVMAADGITYVKKAILEMLQLDETQRSPYTRQQLAHTRLMVNQPIADAIVHWRLNQATGT